MTIQLAQTTDNEIEWRWPTPEGYCFNCGYTHHAPDPTDAPDVHAQLALPESTSAVLSAAAYVAGERIGLPDHIETWQPAHVEAARALVARIQERIDIAEMCLARRAAANR